MGSACSTDVVAEPSVAESDPLDHKRFECPEIVCWGDNKGLQLGLTSNTEFNLDERQIYITEPLSPHRLHEDGVIFVSCGMGHSAAVTRQGSLYTWGAGPYGRLGHGYEKMEPTPRLVSALLGTRVSTVACGADFTLVLTDEGIVYSFGAGNAGQLGLGAFVTFSALPCAVDSFPGKVSKIAAGLQFSAAAILEDGQLFTWGENEHGELGHEDTHSQHTPKPVGAFAVGGPWVVDVSVGYSHMACVLSDGKMYIWGEGLSGQLGQGKFNKFKSPKPLVLDTLEQEKIVACACGGAHSAAVTENGDVYVWGNNQHGQLGTGDDQDRYLPFNIHTSHAIKTVSCGLSFTLCLSVTGQILSFGQNDRGQLGRSPDGEVDGENTPLEVEATGIFTQISASHHHSLALRGEPRLIAKHLGSMLKLHQFSDLELGTAPKLSVHRPIISVRCPALLTHLDDVSPEALNIVMSYVYTDNAKGLDNKSTAFVAAAAIDLHLIRLARLAARATRKPVAITASTFQKDIASLLTDRRVPFDVVLKSTDGISVKAHLIIISRSVGLMQLVSDGERQVKVELNCLALKSFVSYLYTEKMNASLLSAVELLQFSARHQDKLICEALENYILQTSITVERIPLLIRATDNDAAPFLAMQLRQFIRENLDAVDDASSFGLDLAYEIPRTPHPLSPKTPKSPKSMYYLPLSPKSPKTPTTTKSRPSQGLQMPTMDMDAEYGDLPEECKQVLRKMIAEAKRLKEAEEKDAEDPQDRRDKRAHINLRAALADLVPTPAKRVVPKLNLKVGK